MPVDLPEPAVAGERLHSGDQEPTESSSGRTPATEKADDPPPGLRQQIGATRDAAKRLVSSHVELAKAEFGDIAGEIKRVAVLGAIAFGALLAAALLIGVGLPLFLGEWIFGSLGWGVLHGLLLLVGVGVAATFVALGIEGSRIVTGLVIGVIGGVIVALVLGLELTNRAWDLLGQSVLPAVGPGDRPLATALVVLPLVAGLGLGVVRLITAFGRDADEPPPAVGGRLLASAPTAVYVGWLAAFLYSYATGVAWPALSVAVVGAAGFAVTMAVAAVVGAWRPASAALTGLAIGIVLGIVLGGLTALAVGWRVGAALGLALGLAIWIGAMVAALAARGVDGEALKERFIPQQTIDMTKETIEWARERMPLSRKS